MRALPCKIGAGANLAKCARDHARVQVQRVYSQIGDEMACLRLPRADAFAMDGVRWGAVDELFTPAFWKAQAWQHEAVGTYADLRLGRSLAEEVSACLLGGYGMPAELGLAAYARLRERGLLHGDCDESELFAALTEPLLIEGRWRIYRFARQRARYLAASLAYLADLAEPEEDVPLRDALTGAPGVGLKTASWVVRNYRRSDEIAILDVHVVRACALMGVFEYQAVTPSNYERLEASYLDFAEAIGVRAGLLDALMWDYMRRLGGHEASEQQLRLF